MNRYRNFFSLFWIPLLLTVFYFGCDGKETIIDVETPRRNIEVERDKNTGDVDVKVEKKNSPDEQGEAEVGVDVDLGKSAK